MDKDFRTQKKTYLREVRERRREKNRGRMKCARLIDVSTMTNREQRLGKRFDSCSFCYGLKHGDEMIMTACEKANRSMFSLQAKRERYS